MASQEKAPAESMGSVMLDAKSPEKTKPAEPTKTAIGKKFHLQADTPTVPLDHTPAFAQVAVDVMAVGNPAYVIELKERGILGNFFRRAETTPIPKVVEIYPQTYFGGIYGTLLQALVRAHKLSMVFSDQEFYNRVQDVAARLADGCVVITYLKLRAVHLTHLPARLASLPRPRVTSELPIPEPFAFAIQQFGAVQVADLSTDLQYVPAFPETGHLFGLPAPRVWNANAYAQAMEYARKVGIRFAIVDINVKAGSAWWLFEQTFSEGIFELQCILPETNYKDAMALTHSLFLNSENVDPSNVFMDLTGVTTGDFGTMLRNPHQGINISTYFAIEDAAPEVWKNV